MTVLVFTQGQGKTLEYLYQGEINFECIFST
jgi:hypothetical protein